MHVKDTPAGYGIVSRVLHWIMALAIFALFALGWWMVGLDYYHPYYKSSAELHKAAGMAVLVALIVRMVWRGVNDKPEDSELTPLERTASRITHRLFYPLMLVLMLTGYFISTLDGRPIDIFGLFSIPSLFEAKGYESIVGEVHEWLAYATVALAIVHSAGALKHHFLDKSDVLRRMWSGPAND